MDNMDKLEGFLQRNRSVKFIRLQWINYSGVLRARFVPVDRCPRIAYGKVAVHLAQNGIIIPISIAPEIDPANNYHETWDLLPYWSSLRCCGLKANHAVAMSFVDQKDAQARFDNCPRMLLIRALERIEKE